MLCDCPANVNSAEREFSINTDLTSNSEAVGGAGSDKLTPGVYSHPSSLFSFPAPEEAALELPEMGPSPGVYWTTMEGGSLNAVTHKLTKQANSRASHLISNKI